MEDPPELRFEAGQWVSVPFGPKIVRAYSIASTPRAPRRITLSADVAPGGIGSTWFRGLEVGQTVHFKAPFGGFVFNRDDPRRPLFVAEEIGAVPIRAILTDLYETGFARPTTLIDWGRSPTWLPYHADFVALERRHPTFAYHPVVRGEPRAGGEPSRSMSELRGEPRAGGEPSRSMSELRGEPRAGGEPSRSMSEVRGERGSLLAAVEALVGDVAGLVAYVSGGGEMIDAVRAALMAKGLDRKSVKWEKFW